MLFSFFIQSGREKGEGGQREKSQEQIFPFGNPGHGFDLRGMNGKKQGTEKGPPNAGWNEGQQIENKQRV